MSLRGKRKQDVIVADHYGTAKLVLWEDTVDSLEENESYTLKNFVVREYKAKKYLSMPAGQLSKSTTLVKWKILKVTQTIKLKSTTHRS